MMIPLSPNRAVQGGVEEVCKPVVVEQYNEFMGGVDTGDQLLSYYGFHIVH